MKRQLSIWSRAAVYFLMVTFIELAKEFKDVGAAKLADYKFCDWIVLITGIGSVVFVALNSFFDTKYAEYLISAQRAEAAEKITTAPPPAPGGDVPPEASPSRESHHQHQVVAAVPFGLPHQA